MRRRDASVRQGRGPAWRHAWGALDDGSRAELEGAVRHETRIEDPVLEPLVHGLIARARRGWWFLFANAVVILLVLSFWAYAATALWPGLFGAFWVGVLLVYLAVVPWALRRRFRHLGRVEHAQHPLGSSPGRASAA